MRSFLFSAVLSLLAGGASASTVSFENMSFDNYFSWNGVQGPVTCATYFTQDTGYCRGIVDGGNVAFVNRDSSNPATIISNQDEFNFQRVHITAAWQTGLEVHIEGYNDGALLYSQTFTIDDDAPTNTRSNFKKVDEIRIWTVAGTDAGTPGAGPQVVLDALVYFAVVPVPASLPLTATALAGLGLLAARRKRRKG